MMNTKSSIKKNFAYQMIYEVLIIILPFITSPYIARVIGAEGLGIYSYSYSVAYYFVLFSMLGIKNYGNRAIAQVRDDQEILNVVFSNLTAIHILISLVCTIAYIIYILMLKQDEKIYATIQIIYVLSGIFDISWFYFGIEHFKLTVTRNVIIKIANVIFVFLFVKNDDDLWKYCLIMAMGFLLSQLSLWIPLKKYVNIEKPEWGKMVVHIKPLLILFVPAIAVSLYKYMDKIMIGSLSSKAQLGYYENAEKVINIPMTIIASFGTVMLPKMSNLFAKKDKKLSQRYMLNSMEFVMCLAIALAFGLAGVGTIFAPIFWGKKFYLSGYLIMGLSITIPFISFANVIRTQYLIPKALDKEYLTSVIAGAVINLVVNGMLIPKQGAVGAMIGTIMAEVVVCVWQAIVVRKQIPIMTYVKISIRFLPAGLLMLAIVYSIGSIWNNGIVTLLIQILVGASIYAVYCVAYFYKTQNDIFIKMLNNLKKKITSKKCNNKN